MNEMVKLFVQPSNYYRIGTGYNGNSCWEDIKSDSYIAIGWSELGNLDRCIHNKNMRNDICNKLIELYGYKSNIDNTKAG